jgi:hypothetical protein
LIDDAAAAHTFVIFVMRAVAAMCGMLQLVIMWAVNVKTLS